jgi:methylglutaconyl-CoA hydratase
VTLNRPEVHNAFDDRLIADLGRTFERLGADAAIRCVVLAGAGPSFSAGGDLAWMRRMAAFDEAHNIADARALAELFETLNHLPKPSIAMVHGACFAGGVGLVACCDIAIATDDAVFAISEVRLGLVPSALSPYVVAAIGAQAARRYFLTAERFSAAEARRLGLVHETGTPEACAATLERLLAALATGGPGAQARAKALIFDVAERPVTPAITALTALRIAEARASAEAREGLAAFFEKRKPAWRR